MGRIREYGKVKTNVREENNEEAFSMDLGILKVDRLASDPPPINVQSQFDFNNGST